MECWARSEALALLWNDEVKEKVQAHNFAFTFLLVGCMAEKKNQSDTGIETADTENLLDRGGRRRLADRRQCSPSDHFPERRNLRHRRSDNDRRRPQNQTIRKKLERRKMFKEKYSDS